MKKKFLTLALAAAMIVSFVGCDTSKGKDTDDDMASAKTTVAEVTEEHTTKAEATTASPPVNPKTTSYKSGDFTLTAENIAFDSPVILPGAGSKYFDFYKNTLYLLHNNKLYIYKLSDNKFTFEKSIDLEEIRNTDEDCSRVTVDDENNILVSSGWWYYAFRINDDGTVSKLNVKGDLVSSHTKNFAITYRGDDNVCKFADGKCTEFDYITKVKSSFKATGHLSLTWIGIQDDLIYVNGLDDTDHKNKTVVYDSNGNQLTVIQKYSNAAISTKNGYMTASTSGLSLWDKSGNYLGNEYDNYFLDFFLLGVSGNCNNLFPLDDGSILAIEIVPKKDQTSEILTFKIKGF